MMSTGLPTATPQVVGTTPSQATRRTLDASEARTLSPDRAPQPTPHCTQGTDMPEPTARDLNEARLRIDAASNLIDHADDGAINPAFCIEGAVALLQKALDYLEPTGA